MVKLTNEQKRKMRALVFELSHTVENQAPEFWSEQCQNCELDFTAQNIRALKDYCTYTLNRVIEFLAL